MPIHGQPVLVHPVIGRESRASRDIGAARRRAKGKLIETDAAFVVSGGIEVGGYMVDPPRFIDIGAGNCRTPYASLMAAGAPGAVVSVPTVCPLELAAGPVSPTPLIAFTLK